jgi:hypothetical protein
MLTAARFPAHGLGGNSRVWVTGNLKNIENMFIIFIDTIYFPVYIMNKSS